MLTNDLVTFCTFTSVIYTVYAHSYYNLVTISIVNYFLYIILKPLITWYISSCFINGVQSDTLSRLQAHILHKETRVFSDGN